MLTLGSFIEIARNFKLSEVSTDYFKVLKNINYHSRVSYIDLSVDLEKSCH